MGWLASRDDRAAAISPSGTAAASPTYTYGYASYVEEPVLRAGTGGLRYFHRNQQCSITALTDSSGTIKEK